MQSKVEDTARDIPREVEGLRRARESARALGFMDEEKARAVLCPSANRRCGGEACMAWTPCPFLPAWGRCTLVHAMRHGFAEELERAFRGLEEAVQRVPIEFDMFRQFAQSVDDAAGGAR